MDTILDFAAIRIAIIPTRFVSEARYQKLANDLMSLNEIPVSALPFSENGSDVRKRSLLSSGAGTGTGTSSAGTNAGSVKNTRDSTGNASKAVAPSGSTTSTMVGGTTQSQRATFADNVASASLINGTEKHGVSSRGMDLGATSLDTSSTVTPSAYDNLAPRTKFTPLQQDEKEVDSDDENDENDEEPSKIGGTKTSEFLKAAESQSHASMGIASPKGLSANNRNNFDLRASAREGFDESLLGETKIHVKYEVCRKTSSGAVLVPAASEWESFHVFKRIWGVIAVADLSDHSLQDDIESQEAAVLGAAEDLGSVIDQLRNVQESRLLVFVSEGTVNYWNQKSFKTSPGFVVNDIRSRAVTRAEIRVHVLPFLGKVLDHIEHEMNVVQRSDKPIGTIMDTGDTPEKQSKLLKRKDGRFNKILGDYYMLLGSSADALKSYNMAAEKARTNSDRLWLAGAMEGAAAALIIQEGFGQSASGFQFAQFEGQWLLEEDAEITDLGGSLPATAQDMILAKRLRNALNRYSKVSNYADGTQDVALTAKTPRRNFVESAFRFNNELTTNIVDGFSEIFRLYSRKRAKDLEVAAALRLAYFLARIPDRRRELLEVITHASQISEALRLSRKVMVWGVLASFLEYIGAHRKAALFYYKLADWNAIQGRLFEAYPLIYKAADQFADSHWVSLKRSLLHECAGLAANAGLLAEATRRGVDVLQLSSSKYYCELPKDRGGRLTDEKDASDLDSQIVKNLFSWSLATNPVVCQNLFKVLSCVPQNAEGLNFAKSPFLSADSKSENIASAMKTGPFIYSAIDAAETARSKRVGMQKANWCVREPVDVNLSVESSINATLSAEVICLLAVERKDKSKEKSCAVDLDHGSTHDEVARLISDSYAILETRPAVIEIIGRNASKRKKAEFLIKATPRLAGTFTIYGVVFRLFGGVLNVVYFDRLCNHPSDSMGRCLGFEKSGCRKGSQLAHSKATTAVTPSSLASDRLPSEPVTISPSCEASLIDVIEELTHCQLSVSLASASVNTLSEHFNLAHSGSGLFVGAAAFGNDELALAEGEERLLYVLVRNSGGLDIKAGALKVQYDSSKISVQCTSKTVVKQDGSEWLIHLPEIGSRRTHEVTLLIRVHGGLFRNSSIATTSLILTALHGSSKASQELRYDVLTCKITLRPVVKVSCLGLCKKMDETAAGNHKQVDGPILEQKSVETQKGLEMSSLLFEVINTTKSPIEVVIRVGEGSVDVFSSSNHKAVSAGNDTLLATRLRLASQEHQIYEMALSSAVQPGISDFLAVPKQFCESVRIHWVKKDDLSCGRIDLSSFNIEQILERLLRSLQFSLSVEIGESLDGRIRIAHVPVGKFVPIRVTLAGLKFLGEETSATALVKEEKLERLHVSMKIYYEEGAQQSWLAKNGVDFILTGSSDLEFDIKAHRNLQERMIMVCFLTSGSFVIGASCAELQALSSRYPLVAG